MHSKSDEKILNILGVALDRGRIIIDHLKNGEVDKANELLALRKAAIYNFFAITNIDSLIERHKSLVELTVDKILTQNEMLEQKIKERQMAEHEELKKIVGKKFQFRGYADANSSRTTNFEGTA